jgi:hypothetical protein
MLEMDHFLLLNCYTPTTGDQLRFMERRQRWAPGLRASMAAFAADTDKPWCAVMDGNAAPEREDFHGSSAPGADSFPSFTPFEREDYRDFLRRFALRDAFHEDAACSPETRHRRFTFYRTATDARRGRGMRIDFALLAESMCDGTSPCQLLSFKHLYDLEGSDHFGFETLLATPEYCPVGVEAVLLGSLPGAITCVNAQSTGLLRRCVATVTAPTSGSAEMETETGAASEASSADVRAETGAASEAGCAAATTAPTAATPPSAATYEASTASPFADLFLPNMSAQDFDKVLAAARAYEPPVAAASPLLRARDDEEKRENHDDTGTWNERGVFRPSHAPPPASPAASASLDGKAWVTDDSDFDVELGDPTATQVRVDSVPFCRLRVVWE